VFPTSLGLADCPPGLPNADGFDDSHSEVIGCRPSGSDWPFYGRYWSGSRLTISLPLEVSVPGTGEDVIGGATVPGSGYMHDRRGYIIYTTVLATFTSRFTF
jgi:hypothetical protein